MSVPTFAGSSLVTDSERQADGSPRARVSLAEIPGVNGAYAQQAGLGAKEIVVEGVLMGTSNTSSALALAALRTAMAGVRALVGNAPNTFVDCSATSISNCLLQAYDQVGPFLTGLSGTNYAARAAVRAVILVLDTDP